MNRWTWSFTAGLPRRNFLLLCDREQLRLSADSKQCRGIFTVFVELTTLYT